MSELAQETVPRLAPGCRLSAEGGKEDMLLIPEGALRLKGPARAIVDLCDGERAVRQIVDALHQRFPSEDRARIETETIALLSRLRERGAIEYL